LYRSLKKDMSSRLALDGCVVLRERWKSGSIYTKEDLANDLLLDERGLQSINMEYEVSSPKTVVVNLTCSKYLPVLATSFLKPLPFPDAQPSERWEVTQWEPDRHSSSARPVGRTVKGSLLKRANDACINKVQECIV
jgi:hypothetical protein